MKSILKSALLIASLLTLIASCNNEAKEEVKEDEQKESLNPNGDSELAILMREMAEEAEQIKIQIENGKKPLIKVNHPKILTATATEPEKKATSIYESFANVHVQTMQLLNEADTSRMLTLYDNVVNNCLNCHKELCPGPMKRIQKLKVGI